MSSAFAFLTDTYILTLGAQLKRREKVSARLADILSELYIASCVLKHYRDQGSHPQDLPLIEWACRQSLNRIQDSMLALLQNYPIRPLAWILKRIIFPLGAGFTQATDRLDVTLATMLLEPSPSRYRLTQDIYIPHSTSDVLGRLESALTRVIAAEPIEQIVRHAVKQGLLDGQPSASLTQRAVSERIITPEQAAILHAAERARRDVIMVDEFSTDLQQHFDPLRMSINSTNLHTTAHQEHDNVASIPVKQGQ
jgi:acyl-CoA dehydrogenase